jgi:colanic acid biosynthesis glycosyl transferase WcaI
MSNEVQPKGMRFLAINQFFWPDPAPTGQLLKDLCESIDRSVHSVAVICDYTNDFKPDTGIKFGVNIYGAGSGRFSRHFWGRIRSYASFFKDSAITSFINGRADVVLTLTTPPLISLVGTLLKSVRGSRHFIWEMDLYPDIAEDLNVLKRGSLLTEIIGALADFSRKRADGIIVLDEDMKRRLVARKIPENKIFVVENWADGRQIKPAPFSEGPVAVQYSGSLGLAHDERTILEVMRQLRNDRRFRFMFVGGGAKRQQFEQSCESEGIANVEFREYARTSQLSSSLAVGHIGLVTQLPETLGAVVPSKTYGIMAAGRPVLYVGPRDSATARMLEHHDCGWQVDPGDATAMIRLLERLERNRDLLRVAGANARSAFEKHYDKPFGTTRILSILGLAETPGSPTLPIMTATLSA